MKMRRRLVLTGLGGTALALPFLEGLAPRRANAGGEDGAEPFAIFFRQANGVAAQQDTAEIGAEPERFWPRQYGQLDAANMQDRAVGELVDYADKLLIVGNVDMHDFDYGDGHARGAMQGLTAQGPTVEAAAGDSEAAGESIDHRIGAELNADGRESMFMYAGRNSGWLGGACISYRGPGNRRAPLHNPMNAYQTMMGVDSDQFEQIILRQNSINNIVRGQMESLLASSKLSSEDRRRLELHRDAIRDLEDALSCNFEADQEMMLEGLSPGYDSDEGDLVLDTVKAHMMIATLAVACGYTRSVAIQLGSGNDGNTRFRDPDTGQLMENYHYVSHRRLSHDSSGSVIPGSDILHHKVDIQFAQTFKFLLDRLSEYDMPNGEKLLDCGVAVWYNDNGNGPGHSSRNIPYVLAGSAAGFFKQGQYIQASDGDPSNHAKMLNTIASGVGVRKANGDFLDDFGSSETPNGILSELMA